MADAAAAADLTPEQLKELLDPVLFLAFRTGLGDLIEQSRSFLLTEDVQGVCLQSQVAPAPFTAGPFVSEIYRR